MSTLSVTDGGNNTIIGQGAGVLSNSATTCTGLGALALAAITDDDDHVAIGYQALTAANDGEGNTAVGVYSLATLQSGGLNTSIGDRSGLNLVNGNYNLFLGCFAAQNYTGTESSNILISNLGVASENNVMRIGTTGSGATQVQTTYLAGVVPNNNPSVTTGSIMYIDNSTEQVTTAQFLDLPTTASTSVGTVQVNGTVQANWYTPAGTTYGTNIFLGSNAGNFTMTGSSTGPSGNIGIGVGALTNITNDGNNGHIYMGYNAGNTISSPGAPSVVIGFSNGQSATYLDGCTLIGSRTAVSATNLTRCVIMGASYSGGNYAGSEADNILIGNQGVALETNTMRLGTTGSSTFQVNRAFLGGINGATVSNQQLVVIDSISDQLGTIPVPSLYVNRVIFETSGSYTQTEGTSYILVEVIGGGGGGGSAVNTSGTQASVGTGGGAADYVSEVLAITAISPPVSVVVGAAGAGGLGGTSATSGGTSSFGDSLVSYGGTASTIDSASGLNTVRTSYGSSAGSVGFDVIIGGQDGGCGTIFAILQGVTTYFMASSGAGGNSFLGSGGAIRCSVNTGGSDFQNGGNGTGYGSGGGGGSKAGNTSNFDVPGGNGAPGVVLITEYILA